jgi:hypothetical protein
LIQKNDLPIKNKITTLKIGFIMMKTNGLEKNNQMQYSKIAKNEIKADEGLANAANQCSVERHEEIDFMNLPKEEIISMNAYLNRNFGLAKSKENASRAIANRFLINRTMNPSLNSDFNSLNFANGFETNRTMNRSLILEMARIIISDLNSLNFDTNLSFAERFVYKKLKEKLSLLIYKKLEEKLNLQERNFLEDKEESEALNLEISNCLQNKKFEEGSSFLIYKELAESFNSHIADCMKSIAQGINDVKFFDFKRLNPLFGQLLSAKLEDCIVYREVCLDQLVKWGMRSARVKFETFEHIHNLFGLFGTPTRFLILLHGKRASWYTPTYEQILGFAKDPTFYKEMLGDLWASNEGQDAFILDETEEAMKFALIEFLLERPSLTKQQFFTQLNKRLKHAIEKELIK